MLLEEVEKNREIVVYSAKIANLVILRGGYFNPLKAYMGLEDVMTVEEGM